MNAMIVGLGSMGRRRVRLLQKYDSAIVIVGVDAQLERRTQAEKELGIQTAENIESVCKHWKIDVAFVSTSPLTHAALIGECLDYNLHVFTELNLTDARYDENLRLAKEKRKVLFLSSTFLYRKEIQYIKECVDGCTQPLSYAYHAGQYLPDWHPWESYKDFFVGKKETNGCREFMAIEFPWMIDTFGKIKSIYSNSGKNSTLDIDFSDSYQIMFEHEGGHRGMICIDVVSRKAVRNLEIFGEELYLTWNGTPDGLIRYDFEQKKECPIKLYKTVDKRFDYSASIMAICIANFYVLRVIQGLVGLNAGAMVFPVIYMVGVLVNKAPYMASDISYYDRNVLLWLVIGFLLILITMALFFLLKQVEERIRFRKQSLLSIGISVCLFTFVLTGIMGCFVLHRRVFPFIDFPQDVYKPASLFNGVSYFYGAKTKVGHMIANICFSNAALIASLPTIACGLLLVSGVILLKGRGLNLGFLMKSYYGISLLLIPIFTISGQPACARYFAVSILLICLCSMHLLANYFGTGIKGVVRSVAHTKGIVLACFAFYVVEMSLNLPVYNCFSPLWLIRNSEFYDTIRQGEWDAGEAMAWGEELALSGKWIEKNADALGVDIREIRIISNYGTKWFSNPGFQIIEFNEFFDQPDRSFKNTFFVLTKFRLYRSAIPEYIKDIEPLHKIRIKGETTAWIYAGNQLRHYYEK